MDKAGRLAIAKDHVRMGLTVSVLMGKNVIQVWVTVNSLFRGTTGVVLIPSTLASAKLPVHLGRVYVVHLERNATPPSPAHIWKVVRI